MGCHESTLSAVATASSDGDDSSERSRSLEVSFIEWDEAPTSWENELEQWMTTVPAITPHVTRPSGVPRRSLCNPNRFTTNICALCPKCRKCRVHSSCVLGEHSADAQAHMICTIVANGALPGTRRQQWELYRMFRRMFTSRHFVTPQSAHSHVVRRRSINARQPTL
jgi:hypothetical protein